jgi:hypothetical protein
MEPSDTRTHGEMHDFTPFFRWLIVQELQTKTTRAFYKNHPVQEKIYSHPQKPNANIDTTKRH